MRLANADELQQPFDGAIVRVAAVPEIDFLEADGAQVDVAECRLDQFPGALPIFSRRGFFACQVAVARNLAKPSPRLPGG